MLKLLSEINYICYIEKQVSDMKFKKKGFIIGWQSKYYPI